MSGLGAPPRCIVCDIEPRRSFRLSNGSDLLRCPRCRLGWWQWPAFEPAELYDYSYFQSSGTDRGYDDYAALERGLRRTARGRLKRIAALMARERRGAGADGAARRDLMDVGCGPGIFLEEARRAGWQVSGIEVSRYASDEARGRNLPVACLSIEAAQLKPAQLDCVTLWDVIEHLRDPVAALRNAAQALRPGGILALSTADITSLCARFSKDRWHVFNLPEHLFFFSPRSLRTLLARLGCRVVCVRREVNWVPMAYVRERAAKKMFHGQRRRATAWEEWVVPATLFDVLGVYAVRAAAVPA